MDGGDLSRYDKRGECGDSNKDNFTPGMTSVVSFVIADERSVGEINIA